MIRWGSDQNRSHFSRVKRLENWGWQIYNPREVLRAIDPLPQHGDTNNKRCMKCRGSCCARECLWNDFLDSLAYFDSPAESAERGIKVTAEVPTQVAEFIQGGDAGWWTDYIRIMHT